MKLENKKIIINCLHAEMTKKIGELVGRYMVELSDDEATKKSVEANDFITAMLTGGGFPKKDASFLEKNDTLYKEIISLSNDIKKLT